MNNKKKLVISESVIKNGVNTNPTTKKPVSHLNPIRSTNSSNKKK